MMADMKHEFKQSKLLRKQMKFNLKVLLLLLISISVTINANELKQKNQNLHDFAKTYFSAWTASQSPSATKVELENYLSLLTDDIGHQHLPYDSDDSRLTDGKAKMHKGMTRYLGLHTVYSGKMTDMVVGHNVIVIKYDTQAKGIHPQTGEEITLDYTTLEVLDIENGLVSVIRKYSL